METCIKLLGMFIAYDVQILVEKNCKQRLKTNSLMFTNEHLCKIRYISNPNWTFCLQLTETIPQILFSSSFSNSSWHEVNGIF